MKSLSATALLILSSATALGQYAPYYWDTFGSINTNWQANGSVTGSSGLYGTGSVISKLTPPAPANAYEVKLTLNLATSAGSYQSFLRADSLSVTMGSGNAYITELNCSSGSLTISKMANGSLYSLASTTAPCHTLMTVRSVITLSNQILVYVDNVLYTWTVDSSFTSGQPGIGVTNVGSGNSISRVDLGLLDQTAPNAVNLGSVGTSSFPNHVDFQWEGTTDDANGTGVANYQIRRPKRNARNRL